MKSLLAVLTAAVLLVSTAPMTASAAPHDLKITNDTQSTIEFVFISPPSTDRWGDDWLGSDEVISPGDSRHFSITEGCMEDIKVVFYPVSANKVRTWRNFDTCQYDLDVQYDSQ